MNKLIVKQTGEEIGELTGKVVPPFMKTEGRVLSAVSAPHPVVEGAYLPLTIFDPTYTVEIVGVSLFAERRKRDGR